VPAPSLPHVLAADFLTEVRPGQPLPDAGPPEVAIAGRSNVGKSTLLNKLTGRKALARTSKTPGRTRGIMLYDLSVAPTAGVPARPLRLVDLPGYGYAQVSQDERRSWQPLIEGYVEGRATLRLFLTLVDARRELAGEEAQLIEWLAALGVPHRLVVTKIDKVSAGERGALDLRMRRALPEGSPPPLLVSGETGDGLPRLWSIIFRALDEAPGPAEPGADSADSAV
jgi:GTP-binding protein